MLVNMLTFLLPWEQKGSMLTDIMRSEYKSAFLESIYCLHTGRKTWERNDKRSILKEQMN